jgi:hypothetical protein
MTTATAQTVQVGTVFYSSWGYDQTNVDYYVVSALSASGKTATFVAVTSASAGNDRVSVGTAAKCANCLSAIRPLVKANGETVYRHVGSGDARCSRYREDDTRTARTEVLKRRLKFYSGRACANVNSYSSMYQAEDGETHYVTPFGAGH